MVAAIPSKRDHKIYRERNHIEHCFNKRKYFGRIATRYGRLDQKFLAFIHIASAILWMR